MSGSFDDFVKDMLRAEQQRQDKFDVGQAVLRGTDEFGRPNIRPFDQAAMTPLQDPSPSTAQAGLRTGYGKDWAQPGNVNPALAASMRPSTNVEDRRAVAVPSNIPRQDWLSDVLSSAVSGNNQPELVQALEAMRKPAMEVKQ